MIRGQGQGHVMISNCLLGSCMELQNECLNEQGRYWSISLGINCSYRFNCSFTHIGFVGSNKKAMRVRLCTGRSRQLTFSTLASSASETNRGRVFVNVYRVVLLELRRIYENEGIYG